MADTKSSTDSKATRSLPAAPWEDLFEGVSRLKVPGGYLYDIKGKGLHFTPGA